MLIRGFREYTGREPLRSISWVQSARQSRFLVKEQENMTDLSCTILLDVECRDDGTGSRASGAVLFHGPQYL